MTKERKYTCQKCGGIFTGYPPDDFNTLASMSKVTDLSEEIQVKHKCPECKYLNVLYWYPDND